jgi:hypothetical protein
MNARIADKITKRASVGFYLYIIMFDDGFSQSGSQ